MDIHLPDWHWFRWEAAFTWLSGLCLLVVVFYMGGAVFLVDSAVMDLSPTAAIGISLATLIGGWIAYDLIRIIRGIPPGTYTVTAWHEVYGTQAISVTVPRSGTASGDFTFTP